MTGETGTPRAGEETQVTVPGGRVYCRIEGGGEGFPLITIHGGPGVPHDYLEPLSLLGDGRRVVFYDQLGCGCSDRPDDESLWRVDRFVDELEHVRDALGSTGVHVLGHSWGSIVAAEYALRHPRGLRGVVLASPVLSAPRWRQDARVYRQRLPEDVQAVLDRCEADGTTASDEYQAAANVFYRRHMCRLDPWPDSLVRSMSRLSQPVYNYMWGPSEFTATGVLAEYDCTDRLAGIDVPTLFTCGAHDEASPATTEFYHSLVPGSDLVVFGHSSHTPHLEEPERYMAVVGEFLCRYDA